MASQPADISTGLHVFWGSGSAYARRVQMVLLEKGVQHESHLMDFGRGDLKATWFGELFPRRVVPLLVDNGKPLGESAAINLYLEDKFPSPALLPSDDAFTKALCLSRMFEADTKLPAILRDLMSSVIREEDAVKKGEALKGVAERIKNEMALWNGYIKESGSGWICGDAFSLADISLYHHIAQLVERHGLSLSAAGFPLLAKWYETVKARNSAEKTQPPHWVGGPPPEKFVVLGGI